MADAILCISARGVCQLCHTGNVDRLGESCWNGAVCDAQQHMSLGAVWPPVVGGWCWQVSASRFCVSLLLGIAIEAVLSDATAQSCTQPQLPSQLQSKQTRHKGCVVAWKTVRSALVVLWVLQSRRQHGDKQAPSWVAENINTGLSGLLWVGLITSKHHAAHHHLLYHAS